MWAPNSSPIEALVFIQGYYILVPILEYSIWAIFFAMNTSWHLGLFLLFLGILSTSHALLGSDQVIQLDTTCKFANDAKDNYIRFVALPCLTDFEKIRDPDGPWEFWVLTSVNDVTGLKIANYHMNRLGIQVGNATYCANFTVRVRQPKWLT
jgi:hypothetical protein